MRRDSKEGGESHLPRPQRHPLRRGQPHGREGQEVRGRERLPRNREDLRQLRGRPRRPAGGRRVRAAPNEPARAVGGGGRGEEEARAA